jgi:hypothetical protein
MMNLLKIITTLTLLGFFSNVKAQGYCDGPNESEDSNGVISLVGDDNGIECEFAPDEYTVIIYEMALCTSAPTRPTTTDTYDVSSCVKIIDSPSGQLVNLAAGSEMILSDVTRPPDNTYAYGYILMENSFAIKAKKQFTNTMHTYQDGTSGNYCWTLNATANSSDADISGWTNPSPLVQCGGASGSAGTYTEVLDQFDVNEFVAGPITVTGGTLSADLITAATGAVVTASNSADRLFGIQTFTSPVEVIPSSSVFTVSFGVNQASNMWFFEDLTKGPNQYQVYSIGSGPFSTSMSME